ncbi:MAG TPA: WecB/TagA/CpsF family glycosyltransferase, partial [Candidatus Saccharimonadales bacterium]|nr:WecB/TagA/CpsF family glycosyltransferase [Candidatus Saccharimonadales bacterium]
MSQQTEFKKYHLLGVEIDAVTMPQAIDYIASLAADSEAPAGYITKPYVEFLDLAYRNQPVAALLNGSRLTIPDGVALNWAAYYLYGGPCTIWRWLYTLAQIVLSPAAIRRILPERAAGTNFTWPLLERCQIDKLTVFLIGSPQGHGIDQTAAVIQARLPDLSIVGHFSGRFSPTAEEALVAKLRSCQPDVIMVGMGFPRQEQLMARLARQLPHGVLIGEGGTFDYRSFGGNRPKAPRPLQIVGLEWLWRLLLEPQRIRRQLAIPRFIWRVWREGKKG